MGDTTTYPWAVEHYTSEYSLFLKNQRYTPILRQRPQDPTTYQYIKTRARQDRPHTILHPKTILYASPKQLPYTLGAAIQQAAEHNVYVSPSGRLVARAQVKGLCVGKIPTISLCFGMTQTCGCSQIPIATFAYREQPIAAQGCP